MTHGRAGYYTYAMRGLHWVIIFAALAVAGCPRPQSNERQSTPPPAAAAADEPAVIDGPQLVVWTDPLLAVPLAGLEEDFRQLYGGGYAVLSVERGDLLERLGDGEALVEPPDVYVVVDMEALNALNEAGITDPATARTFAGDTLALVQPSDKGYATETLFDIYKLRFDHLAVGAENTTVGYYARQALITEGCFNRLEDRLKYFDRTDDLLKSLATDASPLGIITRSQFVQTDGLDLVLLISERLHEDIRCQAVAAAGHGDNAGIMALLRFLAENEAIQLKLGGYGLVDRQTALVEDR
jgi:molybdenum ABC transporter molybdate-binding protein